MSGVIRVIPNSSCVGKGGHAVEIFKFWFLAAACRFQHAGSLPRATCSKTGICEKRCAENPWTSYRVRQRVRPGSRVIYVTFFIAVGAQGSSRPGAHKALADRLLGATGPAASTQEVYHMQLPTRARICERRSAFWPVAIATPAIQPATASRFSPFPFRPMA